ncbi:MAG: hypothetical protein RSB18_03855, partial [Clostridia bacterium]
FGQGAIEKARPRKALSRRLSFHPDTAKRPDKKHCRFFVTRRCFLSGLRLKKSISGRAFIKPSGRASLPGIRVKYAKPGWRPTFFEPHAG